jgi:hypothetical protein
MAATAFLKCVAQRELEVRDEFERANADQELFQAQLVLDEVGQEDLKESDEINSYPYLLLKFLNLI